MCKVAPYICILLCLHLLVAACTEKPRASELAREIERLQQEQEKLMLENLRLRQELSQAKIEFQAAKGEAERKGQELRLVQEINRQLIEEVKRRDPKHAHIIETIILEVTRAVTAKFLTKDRR